MGFPGLYGDLQTGFEPIKFLETRSVWVGHVISWLITLFVKSVNDNTTVLCNVSWNLPQRNRAEGQRTPRHLQANWDVWFDPGGRHLKFISTGRCGHTFRNWRILRDVFFKTLPITRWTIKKQEPSLTQMNLIYSPHQETTHYQIELLKFQSIRRF